AVRWFYMAPLGSVGGLLFGRLALALAPCPSLSVSPRIGALWNEVPAAAADGTTSPDHYHRQQLWREPPESTTTSRHRTARPVRPCDSPSSSSWCTIPGFPSQCPQWAPFAEPLSVAIVLGVCSLLRDLSFAFLNFAINV